MIYDFKKWLKNKISEDFENNPQGSIDQFNYNNEQPSDNDHIQKELVKILISKYNKEFLKFLGNIGEENSDMEVKNLTKKLEGDNSSSNSWKARFASNQDEIVPPAADRGFDTNEEE